MQYEAVSWLGVLLADPEHPEELGEALLRVLRDKNFREELAARSLSRSFCLVCDRRKIREDY